MANSNVIFAGVPHTGKTTFLALLNLALTSDSGTFLRLGTYKDDREYVNDLAKRLFSCEEPDRTEVGQSGGLTLSVSVPDRPEILLSIPDLSGETWLDLIRDRSWTEELQTLVEEASGVCIFIHAADFREDHTIANVARVAFALGEEAESVDESTNAPFADADFHSGQVQLVDLLQILGKQFASKERRISLVISAFDAAGGQPPGAWIAENAPIVHQYLQNKDDSSEVQIFGLSAQGGRFDDQESRSKLLKIEPWKRAFVRSADGTEVGIDQPLLWAMNID